eukprot:5633998-Pleurochrysis_carterae.AAC.1
MGRVSLRVRVSGNVGCAGGLRVAAAAAAAVLPGMNRPVLARSSVYATLETTFSVSVGATALLNIVVPCWSSRLGSIAGIFWKRREGVGLHKRPRRLSQSWLGLCFEGEARW